LAVHNGRVMEVLKHRVAHGAIATEALDLEEPPLGGKANASQRRKIVSGESSVDVEVAGSVDVSSPCGGLGLFCGTV